MRKFDNKQSCFCIWSIVTYS